MIPNALFVCGLALSACSASPASPSPALVQQRTRELDGTIIEMRRAILRQGTDHLDCARSIVHMHGEAKAAPALLEMFDVEGRTGAQERALEALDVLGEPGTQALIETIFERYRWRMRFTHRRGPDKLTAHLYLLDHHPDEQLRHGIAVALSSMGDTPVRHLLRRIQGKGVPRLHAIQAAAALPTEAKRLVPALSKVFAEAGPTERFWATHSLGQLAPQSLPMLIRATGHSDPAVRACAVQAIARVAPTGHFECQAASYAILREPTEDERASENAILSGLRSAIPALAKTLDDADESTRFFSAVGLYKLGGFEPSAHRALAEALNDPSTAVRIWALHAKKYRIGEPWSLLHALAGALPKEGSRKIETQGRERLLEALQGGRTWNLADSSRSWGYTWPARKDARYEAARRLLLSEAFDEWVRDARGNHSRRRDLARERLQLMERECQQHIRKLLQLLDDELGIGGPAARELVQLGPAVMPALSHDFLRHPRFPMGPPTYQELLWVLGKIGHDSIPTLILGLDHWMPYARSLAAKELGKIGERATVAMPMVLATWRERSDEFPGTDHWWDPAGNKGDGRTRWALAPPARWRSCARRTTACSWLSTSACKISRSSCARTPRLHSCVWPSRAPFWPVLRRRSWASGARSECSRRPSTRRGGAASRRHAGRRARSGRRRVRRPGPSSASA